MRKIGNRWQRYANVICSKVGKTRPEESLINTSDFFIENLQKKEDTDDVLDKNLQHKIHGWYGTLRLSPLDGKLNRNYVPMGSGTNISASETIHNLTKLQMKKPKELMLFSNKPKPTSILESLSKKDGKLSATDRHINEMDELFIQGKSKFNSEVEYCMKIPENQRVYIKTKDAIEEEAARAAKAKMQDDISDDLF